MAIQQNLTNSLGETWPIEVDSVDPDGNPLDLTGGGLQFRLAAVAYGSPSILLLDMKMAAAGPYISQGLETLVVTPEDQAGQAALVSGTYEYEVRSFTSAGAVYVQQFGQIYVRPSLYAAFPFGPTLGSLSLSESSFTASISPVLAALELSSTSFKVGA